MEFKEGTKVLVTYLGETNKGIIASGGVVFFHSKSGVRATDLSSLVKVFPKEKKKYAWYLGISRDMTIKPLCSIYLGGE